MKNRLRTDYSHLGGSWGNRGVGVVGGIVVGNNWNLGDLLLLK